MSPELAVEGLHLRVGQSGEPVHILRGIDLHLHAGETLGIVGESGCGKSSTLLACAGLLGTESCLTGSIRLAGQEISRLTERDWRAIRGRRIACVFQNARGALHPMMAVGRQIARAWRQHNPGGGREARRRALEMLRQVGFADPDAIARRLPQELSGGQCQRAIIALAMVMEPAVLLADEPTSGLDHGARVEVLKALRRQTLAHGTATLIVTHDFAVVEEACDRVAVMYAGQIVETGPAAAILARPAHPYTRALLAARDARARRMPFIPGSIPDLRTAMAGCDFAPRCGFARPVCHQEMPLMAPRGEKRQARCRFTPEELVEAGNAA
ncbi:MAG: ABC transporter ATP-binding protein [Sphingobium sp.]